MFFYAEPILAAISGGSVGEKRSAFSQFQRFERCPEITCGTIHLRRRRSNSCVHKINFDIISAIQDASGGRLFFLRGGARRLGAAGRRNAHVAAVLIGNGLMHDWCLLAGGIGVAT